MLQIKYKYPEIVRLVETHSKINPIYLNPHFNLVEYFLQNPDQIDWFWLSRYPSDEAINILDNNIHKINVHGLVGNLNPKVKGLLEKVVGKLTRDDWSYLSKSHNPGVMLFLEEHLKKIDWSALSANTCEGAIRILKNNLGKVVWYILSANPSAIEILESNFDKVDLYSLGTNSGATHLIEAHLDNMNFEALSQNKMMIHILKQNLGKVSKFWFSRNDNAVDTLTENFELVDFDSLLMNPSATKLLEQHMDKITDFIQLSYNPNCVQLFQKMLEAGLIPEDEMEYIFGSLLLSNKSVYDLE